MTSPEVTWFKPEVTWFERENRGPVGKNDRGLRTGQNRRETRAQSPKSKFSIGGDPLSENNIKKIINTLLSCHTFFLQQVREKK